MSMYGYRLVHSARGLTEPMYYGRGPRESSIEPKHVPLCRPKSRTGLKVDRVPKAGKILEGYKWKENLSKLNVYFLKNRRKTMQVN